MGFKSSPFDLLATEIIQWILIYATLTTDHANRVPYHCGWNVPFPHAALLVSSRWRSIATSCPRLWTTLYFQTHINSDSLSTKTWYHARLAKGLPLHLVIHITTRAWPPSTFHFPPPVYKSIRVIVGPAEHALGHSSIMPSLRSHGVLIGDNAKAVEDLGIESTWDRVFGIGDILIICSTMPNLRHLSVRAPASAPRVLWHGRRAKRFRPPSYPCSLANLTELVLCVCSFGTLRWLRDIALPALESLAISCELIQDVHEIGYWRNGPWAQFASVRRAALFRVGEHASRLILRGLPALEHLAVSCDPHGRLPACLDDVIHWPNLTKLAIKNGYAVRMDRVREKVERRLAVLKVVSVDSDFAEAKRNAAMMKWLRENVPQVEVWPFDDFTPSRSLYRLENWDTV